MLSKFLTLPTWRLSAYHLEFAVIDDCYGETIQNAQFGNDQFSTQILTDSVLSILEQQNFSDSIIVVDIKSDY